MDKYEKAVLSDENIGLIDPKEAKMKAHKKSTIESESDGDENQSVEKPEHPRSLKKELER